MFWGNRERFRLALIEYTTTPENIEMRTENTRTEQIREAFERGKKAVTLRPAVGQGTAVTTARITDGYTCEIEEGPWKLTVDMPEKHGGDNRGPNSGIIGRGALASCLAIGYIRWAAALEIPLEHLEVEVHADYDVRGEFGVADVPPGYTGMRYVVRVQSSAPEDEILRMLNRADMLSPYLDIFANPHRIERDVEYTQLATAEADHER